MTLLQTSGCNPKVTWPHPLVIGMCSRRVVEEAEAEEGTCCRCDAGLRVAKAGGDDDVGLWRKLQRIVVVGCSDGWRWLRVCGAGDADLQR